MPFPLLTLTRLVPGGIAASQLRPLTALGLVPLVRRTAALNSVGLQPPSITAVTGAAYQGQMVIAGINFGASGAAVTIGGVAQTVTGQTTTSITVNPIARGSLGYGYAVPVVVTTALGLTASYSLTTGLTPQSGWVATAISTPNPTAGYRMTSVPDLAAGDEIAVGNIVPSGTVTLYSDGTFACTFDVAQFTAEVWTTGGGWGTQAVQIISQGQTTQTTTIRVKAVAAGFYQGDYRDIGDVFDIAQSDYSPYNVSLVPVGNPDYPLYGWMMQVPSTTPLYDAASATGASSTRQAPRRTVL